MPALTRFGVVCSTSINVMQNLHIFAMMIPAIRISGPNSLLGLHAGCDA
jgi:hypothetical protein